MLVPLSVFADGNGPPHRVDARSCGASAVRPHDQQLIPGDARGYPKLWLCFEDKCRAGRRLVRHGDAQRRAAVSKRGMGRFGWAESCYRVVGKGDSAAMRALLGAMSCVPLVAIVRSEIGVSRGFCSVSSGGFGFRGFHPYRSRARRKSA